MAEGESERIGWIIGLKVSGNGGGRGKGGGGRSASSLEFRTYVAHVANTGADRATPPIALSHSLHRKNNREMIEK